MIYLEKSLEAEVFSSKEAAQFIYAISEDRLAPESIAGVLVSIQQRGITLDEIKGFRNALLDLALVPNLERDEAIDVCGTGGDGKNTFNVSTTTALVLAAMGKRVIKHGNYAVSSSCGSSDVLGALGIPLHTDSTHLARQLERSNICFLHAPYFHPTMKKVAPVRKALGIRTAFNVLGPLVNPVQTPYQLSGTYSLELAYLYQHLLSTERQNFQVVHSMDGYDEISLTGDFRVLGLHCDLLYSPSEFAGDDILPSHLRNAPSPKQAARLIRHILGGTGTRAQNEVVAVNTALALNTLEPHIPFSEHYPEVLEFLSGGRALYHLKHIQ